MDYVRGDVTNLALVYGFMMSLGVTHYQSYSINLSMGLLL
jgi:hypothetical protein